DGTERGKLRDVERLIRRTLPVSGDLKQPELTPPKERKAHRGQGPKPAGRTNEQRPQRNAGRHFSGAKKAAIGEARAQHKPRQEKPAVRAEPPASATAKTGWWEKP